jgi:TonB family protein
MSQRNVTHWLIHHAARHAPEALAERLEEEWLADLEARTSGVSRLRFAIGCCWATQVIAWEHQPSKAAVSSTAVAGQGLIAYADQNFRFISLRSSTFFLVLSLHIVLIYGFMTALSHTHKIAAPDPLQNHTLNDPLPREKLPLPLPGPTLKSWTIDVPIPVVNVPPEPIPGDAVMGNVVEKPAEPTSPSAPTRVVKQVAGGPGAGFPDTADFYPSLSIHLGEQGISTVRVCVDAKGRLTSDPRTLNGSGSTRLDEGALKLARAGSGHYRAATEDGQPVSSCYPLGIRFQLKN